MDLTAAQWEKLKPLLAPKRRSDGRGRPWRDTQAVLNGVLWVLRTGAPWHDLPDRYPPYQTCHRRSMAERISYVPSFVPADSGMGLNRPRVYTIKDLMSND
jgi:transposase